MLTVGLTGGMGAGKSTVAAMLAARGAVVIDADRIARDVVEPGRPAYTAVVERFGPGVLLPDGRLDRHALASVVFSDPAALADLNAITHPAIAAVIGSRLAVEQDTDRVVVLDIPLLTAALRTLYGMAGVIVVDAPVEVAVDRLVRERGLTEADVRARIAAQPSREERLQQADTVVDNSRTPADLEIEVERVWEWILGQQDRDRGASTRDW